MFQFLLLVLAAGCCSIATHAAHAAPRGTASWYGEEHRGRLTASGEPFDPDALTCASWFYPIGQRLIIRHGPRKVTVRVNDRGPHWRLVRRGRIIDLSAAAFGRISELSLGLVAVEITPLPSRTP